MQGVGYRNFAQGAAVKLGLRGYARNLDDGRVEVYAIGAAEKLDELAEHLRRGPRWAEVRSVEVMETEINVSFTTFRIER